MMAPEALSALMLCALSNRQLAAVFISYEKGGFRVFYVTVSRETN